MREREQEMNLMGEMFIRDIQEVIREESQQVYSTTVEEEDVDGSSLKTMRKELKKELDHIRGDENGWKTFIPERNMIIDQEKVGIEVSEDREKIKPSKRRRKSTLKLLCPVGRPNFINFRSASNCTSFKQASKNDRRNKVRFYNLCERFLKSKDIVKHEEYECLAPPCKIC